MHDPLPATLSPPCPARPQARHPGPPDPVRMVSVAGHSVSASITLPAGSNLRDAISTALRHTGIEGATIRIENMPVAPLHYLMPALSADQQHAAFYSAPQTAAAVTIELACATIGQRDGTPFVHCHATWTDHATAQRHGGHLLCDQTILAAPVQAQVWGLRNATMHTQFDPETGFTLFHPSELTQTDAVQHSDGARTLLARIRPDVDLCTAIEQLCRLHHIRHAIVRGSVGSLVGAEFTDGRVITDLATEILVRSGQVGLTPDGWHAMLDIALIDPRGHVCEGVLARGCNPVLICFELVLEEVL